MARRQYAKVTWYAEYRVIHDDDRKHNEWIVTKRNRKIAEFADFTSCILYLAGIVSRKESEVI